MKSGNRGERGECVVCLDNSDYKASLGRSNIRVIDETSEGR